MKLSILILLLIFPILIFSQTSISHLRKNPLKFSITGYGILNNGGPINDVDKTMFHSGFNAHVPGWFSSGYSYPIKLPKYSSMMLGIKYYFKLPYLSVSLFLSSVNFGGTKGKHLDSGYLQIDHKLFCISPTISFNPSDLLRIGAGPALYMTESSVTDGNLIEGKKNDKHAKLGFLLDLSLRFPKKTLYYCEIICQYRKVGQNKIGPYTVELNGNTAVLPKHKVNFDHSSIGIGIGFRFLLDKVSEQPIIIDRY